MEILYQSKGISKKTITKRMISIVLCLVMMAVLIAVGSSKVEGPAQNISVGGGSSKIIRQERSRFSAEEQKGIVTLAVVFGLVALADAGLLAGARTSWLEVRTDSINANSMGKTVSYAIHEITKISKLDDYLIISGTGGTAILVAEDPDKAQKLISRQMKLLKRNAR